MEHTIILNQSKNNWSDKDRIMINAFIEYLFAELHIKNPVTIKLEDYSEDTHNVGVNINLRLAFVDLIDRLIIIYCTGRGLLDILRSIAHELIHVQQYDLGQLGENTNIPMYLPNSSVAGYEFEYEAYGLSGILVRNFRAILNNNM